MADNFVPPVFQGHKQKQKAYRKHVKLDASIRERFETAKRIVKRVRITKDFSIFQHGCPHCGKQYPKLNGQYWVIMPVGFKFSGCRQCWIKHAPQQTERCSSCGNEVKTRLMIKGQCRACYMRVYHALHGQTPRKYKTAPERLAQIGEFFSNGCPMCGSIHPIDGSYRWIIQGDWKSCCRCFRQKGPRRLVVHRGEKIDLNCLSCGRIVEWSEDMVAGKCRACYMAEYRARKAVKQSL